VPLNEPHRVPQQVVVDNLPRLPQVDALREDIGAREVGDARSTDMSGLWREKAGGAV
jgi:hypothetical protein